MKIKQIRAVQLNIPHTPPTAKPRRPNWNNTAPRALPINKYPEFPTTPGRMQGAGTKEDFWVQVIAEDGTWGLGQTSFGEITASLVDYHYAPLLEGRDCFALEFLNDLMWRSSQRIGAGGLATVAQSGIDLALWDLKGKLMDQPVYSLIGGPCRDKALCYVTSDDLDWSMELGFKHFKVSNPVHYDMGISGLNLMEEKIAKARDTVGHDAELMYNPTMSFNVEFTVRMAERLRPYNLRWLEEPLIPTDLEGHMELRAVGREQVCRHPPARYEMVWWPYRGLENIYHWRSSGDHHYSTYGSGVTLGATFCDFHARIPHGRILDGHRSGDPTGTSLPNTRDAHAKGWLRLPFRCPWVRYGNRRQLDHSVGSLHSIYKSIITNSFFIQLK